MKMPISLIKEEEEHILRVLPVLLRKDDRFRQEVSIVLSETFATKGELKQVLEEIRISREESNRRFEEQNKRFEAMDKRFEAIQRQMDKRFEEQGKRIEEHTRAIEKVSMSIRTVGSRWGIEAEGTIRNTLKELLLKGLKVAAVSEWKAKDKEGMVGKPNSDIQVDLLIRNGEHWLVEIKSSADDAHVNRLYKIGEFYKKGTGINPRLLFVAVMMEKEGRLLCGELGIQLITYDELEGG